MNRIRCHEASEDRLRAPLPGALRRGIVAVAIVMALVLLDLIIIGMVVSGARDSDLTVRRLETIESFYASEAGVNMSMREMVENDDEDGDTKIGGVSDDGDADNDPTLGSARVFVTATTVEAITTLVSEGRSGNAKRTSRATVR